MVSLLLKRLKRVWTNHVVSNWVFRVEPRLCFRIGCILHRKFLLHVAIENCLEGTFVLDLLEIL